MKKKMWIYKITKEYTQMMMLAKNINVLKQVLILNLKISARDSSGCMRKDKYMKNKSICNEKAKKEIVVLLIKKNLAVIAIMLDKATLRTSM